MLLIWLLCKIYCLLRFTPVPDETEEEPSGSYTSSCLSLFSLLSLSKCTTPPISALTEDVSSPGPFDVQSWRRAWLESAVSISLMAQATLSVSVKQLWSSHQISSTQSWQSWVFGKDPNPAWQGAADLASSLQSQHCLVFLLWFFQEELQSSFHHLWYQERSALLRLKEPCRFCVPLKIVDCWLSECKQKLSAAGWTRMGGGSLHAPLLLGRWTFDDSPMWPSGRERERSMRRLSVLSKYVDKLYTYTRLYWTFVLTLPSWQALLSVQVFQELLRRGPGLCTSLFS